MALDKLWNILYRRIKIYYLQALYDNGWDASFDYNGQVCGIFPNSVYDIVVVLGDNEYKVVSFDELISL